MNLNQFKRHYSPLDNFLRANRVLVVYGPRRVGKTTLINDLLSITKLKYKLDSGEDIQVQNVIGSSDFQLIKSYCEGYELIVIDEAQHIPNVGLGLKIIVDQIPGIHVLVSGSSSFDLTNKIGEPLVGRQKVLRLFPISISEILHTFTPYEINQKLNEWMIFGLYPEVLTETKTTLKIDYLRELVNSYLLKDLLALESVKSSKILFDLLRLLAFQVGSEVSANELSSHLKIDVKTVLRYLDLLEKTFILQPLGGFSRNLRNEITSKKKYYFYDNGVRNSIINSFNTKENRNDWGALWENFLVIERLKIKSYTPLYANDFFWRTYSGKEIDLIEERDGKLFGYEFKWAEKNYRIPKDWSTAYPDAPVQVISSSNYLPFITETNPTI